ncbi:MAG TPA: hypothetical protein EYO73_00830 [Sulfurimonas sp.]|nr:hypothetical protein [Sulfurimonas sp.]
MIIPTSQIIDKASGLNAANEDGDDNPNIQKYLGYGDITVDYLAGNN